MTEVARDTSFYYSFLVLPGEQRDAIVAVWDFCRAVDDAADEADGEEAERAVARWREELARCYDGRTPETPQGRALQPLIPRFHLPRSAFDALVEGVEMDLHPRRYETFADLYEYCIRVASAVGLLCVAIFGCTDPGSRQYAIELGVALQLTNILRDVSDDFGRGRVYIPLEDLERFACTDADLANEIAHAGGGVRSDAVRRLLASQAARARGYYARADASLPQADARRLLAARIMGAIYRGILTRIERGDYDIFSRVIRVPRPQRALMALGLWTRALVTGR
jgi:15-cis-phytoene synthase